MGIGRRGGILRRAPSPFAQGVVDDAVGKGGDEDFFAVAGEGGGQVSLDPGPAGRRGGSALQPFLQHRTYSVTA
jgi:hypothetical protein